MGQERSWRGDASTELASRICPRETHVLCHRMDMTEIDTVLVERLVRTQFPQWADLPVTPVGNPGWDNRNFRLGDRMSVRLPSASRYAAQIEKEYRWLPILRPHLPLPIPLPLGLGAPGAGFSWPWSIYGWLEGKQAHADRIENLGQFAVDLAGFLVALQRIETNDGPLPGHHNFHRGGSLMVYDAETREAPLADDKERGPCQ